MAKKLQSWTRGSGFRAPAVLIEHISPWHFHVSSQPFVTPLLRNPRPSSGLLQEQGTQHIHRTHTNMQAKKLATKIEKNSRGMKKLLEIKF